MTEVKVHVEYCGRWGYGPRYQALAARIAQAVPSAVCHGEVGRQSSFEVSVNGDLVYSKLQSGNFPDYEDVVKVVEAVVKGEAKPEIKKGESGCTIL